MLMLLMPWAVLWISVEWVAIHRDVLVRETCFPFTTYDYNVDKFGFGAVNGPLFQWSGH